LTDDIKLIILDTLRILLGATRPRYYQQLARSVNAFTDEGLPKIAAPERAVKISTLLARIGEGSEQARRVVITMMIILVFASVLVGKIDIGKIMQLP
jgi:hypothetical protein